MIGSRVYPITYPETPTFPLVTYQRISTVTTPTLDDPLDLTQVRIQFDSWSQSYQQSRAVADALTDLLEGFSGTLPNGVRVAGTELAEQTDEFESIPRNYRVSTDLFVSFYRDSPAL